MAVLLTACAPGDQADLNALQGNWKPVSAELAGQPMADTVLNSLSLRLYRGRYEAFVGSTPDRGAYSLDPTSRPRGMTVTGTDGPNKGKTFPCIYELQGDTLRICYDLSGTKRPTDFKTLAGTKLYLATYARKKE